MKDYTNIFNIRAELERISNDMWNCKKELADRYYKGRTEIDLLINAIQKQEDQDVIRI